MIRLSITLFLVVVTASFAWGVRGPQDVSAGKHNLSSSYVGSATYRSNEDSLCVFCHTPHGGSLEGPLWNRENPTTTTWSHYNSATMSSSIKVLGASRPPNAESMLCLSCHDGSISVNHVINLPNDRAGAPILSENLQPDTKIQGLFGNPGSRIGGAPGFSNYLGNGLLADDHPISFSYTEVLASAEYQPGKPKYDSLHNEVDAVNNGGVKLFTGTFNVECSSCHDPHVDFSATGNDAYTPFLITPNAGSALCLACHKK